MCQPNQLNERLQSLKRMTDLFQCKQVQPIVFSPQIIQSDDPFSVMIKILPFLLKFIIMCLTHKKEIVRMSALKLLEFILDTKGCSLDQSMIFILKALINTYPQSQQQPIKNTALRHQSSFGVKGFTQSVQDYFQYQEQSQNQIEIKNQGGWTEYKSIKEPTSGFLNALKNAYNHALDSYISVLSSVSSHILHQLFYEVIIPSVISPNQEKSQNDIKIFSIKIAEKIITICQGDLVLSKTSLEYFLSSVIQKSSSQQALSGNNNNNSETFQSALKNLWQSIRTKVFTNYSQKGLRTLIEWLVDKMSQIAQNAQMNSPQQILLTDSSGNQDISKLEITDEDNQQLLQLFDIVSMISVGRKNNEAEANSLIKIKQEYCLELYLLINPLLFWLDFSVEREERFPLFKSVYSTIKDVLENLPAKRVDIDMLQIMIPILQRTTEFLKNNSPSLQMLKFLDIVLRDLKQGGFCQQNPDLQYFFLDMLNNFVGYISYCLYEEIFSVFDKLLSMCNDVINEKVLIKCIVALVDKYTIKSKAHKNSLTIFMKGLMEVKVRTRNNKYGTTHTITNTDDDLDEDQISVHSKNNYFEILCDFCFFNNKDPLPHIKLHQVREDFKSPLDLHDLYIDKLQFFVDTLSLMTEMHVNLFTSMITHPQFKPTLMGLLQKGETQLRLKCHEILEIVSNYYVQHCTSKTVYKLSSGDNKKNLLQPSSQSTQDVMEVEYINQERLYLSQLVLQAVTASLQQANDSYLQFNSLILLDFLFQNLMPVPTYQNEMAKERINKSGVNKDLNVESKETIIADLEKVEINEETPEFEVTSNQYTLMRLELIFKLWPHIQLALNSAWSNIRSICYGLICSMLKVDLKDLESIPSGKDYVKKLKLLVLPMLQSLLSSKESESKAGGLNILGSFCGLSYDFSKVKISKNLDFFKKNSSHISIQIWQLVFDLQDDWDITIKEASVVLIQLCAPRDTVKYFDRVKRDGEDKRFNEMLQRYGLGQNGINTNGNISSRQSSARGVAEHQLLMQNSLVSNEDLDLLNYQKKKPASNTAGSITMLNNTNNILSYLSGTDEMSLLFQIEQQQQQQQNQLNQHMSGSQIFEQIGDGTNAINNNTFKLQSELQLPIGPSLSTQTLEREDQFELNENQKKILLDTQHLQYQDNFDFFVDTYSDDQIQEIISIFRNDFKPPKNLWIEKNSSSNGFILPDYYAEIYSSAIDQFNQQQMQLQQQQQQQQQMMVNNSPKSSASKSINIPTANMVDALEDDLVKRYENEKKEKEKNKGNNQDQKDSTQKANGQDNYMIFERHFEDGKEVNENSENKAPKTQEQEKKDQNSIDAEPFQFLDSSPKSGADESKPTVTKKGKKASNNPSEKRKSQPAQQLQINVIEEFDQKIPFTKNDQQTQLDDNKSKKTTIKDRKTTDELIEEYERKISKTKQLLEEEKKRNKQEQQEANIKQTPDFKQKKESSMKVHQINNEEQLSKSNEKKKQHDLLPKNFLSNMDNAKLIKQINNCFNDNSFNNFNIGPVVMTANIGQQSGSTNTKKKLNKSFENLMAANKNNLKQQQNQNKKNLSSSPRRGSSSGKKSASSKSGNSKKRYLMDYQQSTKPKALYNMRDLNYFIKTIEKDLSDKFNKLNLKDFNSMPTTPTSILKKVEDQMKALAVQNQGYNKPDIKNQMSNTCPNITQILGQFDNQGQQQNQVLSQKLNTNSHILQLSHLNMNDANKGKLGGLNDFYQSNSLTPSNVSNNIGNLGIAQSQNSLSNYSIANNMERFSFSKTQKIDFKETNKNIMNYQVPGRDGQTARDRSSENNYSKIHKPSPINDLKKPKTSQTNKRQRVSQDKYLSSSAILSNAQVIPNNNSSSSSHSKLNKSLNNISQVAQIDSKKKEQLSKSMITNFTKQNNNNISPSNKKMMQQMIKNQFSNIQSSAGTIHNQQTSMNTQQQMANQYSYSSNLLYDYIQSSEQTQRKTHQSTKTPLKPQNQKITGKGGNYSEILEISPTSAEKEIRYFSNKHII